MLRVLVQGTKALVVTSDIGPNVILRPLQGKILPNPTRTSICISANRHIEDHLGCVVNHSCNPTARVYDGGLWTNVPMTPGTEVTIDYRKTEYEMAAPFDCIQCGGRIVGTRSYCLDELLEEQLEGHWKAYL